MLGGSRQWRPVLFCLPTAISGGRGQNRASISLHPRWARGPVPGGWGSLTSSDPTVWFLQMKSGDNSPPVRALGGPRMTPPERRGLDPAAPGDAGCWHGYSVNSRWSLHGANSPLIRFMYLFFLAVGFGSANCVAAYSVSRKHREFPASLGGLPRAPQSHHQPHTPGLQGADPSGTIRPRLAASEG